MPPSKKKKPRARARAKRRDNTQVLPPPDDNLPSWPGFPVLTEEAATSQPAIHVWRESLLAWIREEVKQVETILLQFNTFDMLANLSVIELAHDPETYKEITHQGSAAVIEYVASLYLKHPFNDGEISVIDGRALTEVQERVNRILSTIILYYSSENLIVKEEEAGEILNKFRHHTITNELFVRNPGYPHHHRERLHALFAPVEDWMVDQLGFSVADVLAIDEPLQELMNRKFMERLAEAKKRGQELRGAVRAYRIAKNKDLIESELIKHLAELPSKQIKTYIKHWAAADFFNSLGREVLSFTAEELAQETGMALARIQAFLHYFAQEFGSISSDFFMLSPTNELRWRPFLHHDSTYLYPLPGTLIWAVQPRFEASLNPNVSGAINHEQQLWKRYVDKRAQYLEQESLSLLASALRHAQVYHSLRYHIIEGGVAKQVELDGLICYDTTLFLLEAKAGGFTLPARRGGQRAMMQDLQQLIGSAYAQALRAKRYIEDTDIPEFVLEDGTKIQIDKSRFRRILLITVSLESLDVFNTILFDVAKLGIFEDVELPWAVSLDTLRVICELNEFPAQLVHYLLRRLRVNEIGMISAHDELDWFGNYLLKGLYFEKESKSDVNAIHLLSHSTAFDDYYFYKTGQRKTPAPQPVQPMPERLREIVMDLERSHEARYSEAILQLLDWDDKSRNQLATSFDHIRKLTRLDRGIHDCTIASAEEKSGITCFAANLVDAEKAFERLQGYVQLKKYQQHADSWLGLLTLIDQPGLIHGIVTGIFPWEPDEELEVIVAAAFGTETDVGGTGH